MQEEYTVGAWAEIGFARNAGKWRASTEGGYRNLIYRHIVPGVGKIKLAELKPHHISAFYKALAESGLGSRSIWCVHLLLRHCLDDAQALGYQPIFTLMLTVGLRQRELFTLKWSDLDERASVLTISEGRCVVKGKLTDYGGSTRQITLTPEMVALLRQEHNRHPSSEEMFVHPSMRKPYAPTMVRLLHQRIMEKAGLDHIRFEDLRHTFATMAMQSGVDVKTLSSMLGHYSAGFTLDTYTHVTNRMQQSAADKVGGFMDEVTGTTPAPEPPDPEPTAAGSGCKIIPFERAG